MTKVVLIGLGAVGLTYAVKLRDKCDLSVLVDKERLERYTENKPVFNGEELKTKDGDSNICWTWWLRSPGYTQGHVAMVFGSGDVYEDGSSYPSFSDCVRPAVYIKLK